MQDQERGDVGEGRGAQAGEVRAQARRHPPARAPQDGVRAAGLARFGGFGGGGRRRVWWLGRLEAAVEGSAGAAEERGEGCGLPVGGSGCRRGGERREESDLPPPDGAAGGRHVEKLFYYIYGASQVIERSPEAQLLSQTE